ASAFVGRPPGTPTANGAFFTDDRGYVRAEHSADHSPVTAANPAHPGEAITVYGNDFYTVWPTPPVGFRTPSLWSFCGSELYQYRPELPGPAAAFDYRYLYLQKYVYPDANHNQFTDTPAVEITFQGLAPEKIGIEQIDFVVPANQPPGDWAL